MLRDDGQSDQNLSLVVRSQAEAMIFHGDNTRPPRLNHHDASLLSQAHLSEPVNDVRCPIHLDHMANFASRH